MLRVRRRIENLERAFVPLDAQGAPEVMTVDFVDAQKNVVDTVVIKTAQALPSHGRRWNGWRLPPLQGTL